VGLPEYQLISPGLAANGAPQDWRAASGGDHLETDPGPAKGDAELLLTLLLKTRPRKITKRAVGWEQSLLWFKHLNGGVYSSSRRSLCTERRLQQ